MAKKPSRSGGRVTPKGTQPAPSKSSQAPSPRSSFDQTTRNQPPPNGRSAGAPGGPSRAGRRGGNR
jgi:hypothetical protein